MTSSAGGSGGESALHALIIGLGSIGQRHARNLRALLGSSVRLTAFRARRTAPTIADNMATAPDTRPEDAYQIESFDSLDDALEQQPDVAFICNPTSHHLDVAIRCAESGCDLFIEKPVAASLSGLDALVSAVEDRELIVGVSSQLRFHPALRRLHQALRTSEIGRPIAARIEVGEYLPGFHPYEDYRIGYAARRELGGGVVLTLIHEIDYLVWLFGVPRQVFAVGGHLSPLELDVEDVASALMACGDDARTFPVHLQMDFVRRPPRRGCQVLCEAGSADVDLRTNRVVITNGDGSASTAVEEQAFERNGLFLSQMTDFLEARRLRRRPEVTLQDGIDALRVACAIRESMATRTAVGI